MLNFENLLLCFSHEGELFIMHDSTLERTTDVRDKYPGTASLPASYFNISQLLSLSTGQWFIQVCS